tara:strand:+ start:419 stop:1138 length:720 start_codon:yes stop_codon:yes gene_type:complete
LTVKSLFSRFFFKNEEKNVSNFISDKFFYNPKKIELFIQAVTHKSKTFHNKKQSNERFEFLGDAILDAVVADFLCREFPNSDEGQLTRIKSKIVNRKSLSSIGIDMKIRTVLDYDNSRSINLASLEGNALEAIIGAIYLDAGYDQVKKSILKIIISRYGDFTDVLKEEIDFKSKLHIWCQRKRYALEYKVISEKIISGSWDYSIEAYINNKPYGQGRGPNKKVAEQIASKETIELLGGF